MDEIAYLPPMCAGDRLAAQKPFDDARDEAAGRFARAVGEEKPGPRPAARPGRVAQRGVQRGFTLPVDGGGSNRGRIFLAGYVRAAVFGTRTAADRALPVQSVELPHEPHAGGKPSRVCRAGPEHARLRDPCQMQEMSGPHPLEQVLAAGGVEHVAAVPGHTLRSARTPAYCVDLEAAG